VQISDQLDETMIKAGKFARLRELRRNPASGSSIRSYSFRGCCIATDPCKSRTAATKSARPDGRAAAVVISES